MGKSISWATPDGVRIVGLFQAPREPKGKTWILLHGLGSNKQEWLGFVRQLARQGDGFLIFDMRGHGDSTQMVGGQTLSFKDFRATGPGSPWETMIWDIRSAVHFPGIPF